MSTILRRVGHEAGGTSAEAAHDSRLVVGAETLLRLALSATDEASTDHLAAGAVGFPNPKMLLTLTAYSYAAGIFDSEEIASLIHEESRLRYLTVGQVVNEDDIQRFRRRNGPLLLSVLRHVLAVVAADGNAANSNRPTMSAEERVHLAIQLDSMRLDD